MKSLTNKTPVTVLLNVAVSLCNSIPHKAVTDTNCFQYMSNEFGLKGGIGFLSVVWFINIKFPI